MVELYKYEPSYFPKDVKSVETNLETLQLIKEPVPHCIDRLVTTIKRYSLVTYSPPAFWSDHERAAKPCRGCHPFCFLLLSASCQHWIPLYNDVEPNWLIVLPLSLPDYTNNHKYWNIIFLTGYFFVTTQIKDILLLQFLPLKKKYSRLPCFMSL